MRNVFACGAVMLAAAIGHGEAKPLTVMSGRPVVDGVYLNGHGPFRFLIDTGAETNQVEASIAHKIGLAPTFRVDMVTTGGTVPAAGGEVAEVRLGSAVALGQEFLFTGLDGVHQLSAGIQGVLGEEFLSRFDYLLDFAGRRIEFVAAEPEGGCRTGFTNVDGRPAIATDRGELVLDSGTATAILYASGITSVSEARELRFKIAGRSYSIAAASAPRGGFREDGVIPASFFQAVYVSNSGQYLILNPKSRT